MCEQTEINYLDGDVVWVKLGACWWPGQVTGLHNLPEDIQLEFQKKPLIAAVKFFQEDTYEFVKNYQQIYKYNCTLKDEFIRKGLDKYRSKSKDGSNYMDKFPGDIEMAEKLTGGDPDILNQEKFSPAEKPDISALFGEKKMPKKKRDREDGQRQNDSSEIVRKITHPRFLRGESDHEVRIRQQPSSLPSTPTTSTSSPQYPCHHCGFTSSRINVIICHIKSHRSDGDTPTIRSKIKTYSQSYGRTSDAGTPKRKYVRKDKSQSSKKRNESGLDPIKRKHFKQNEKASKKKKTDPELREKLLADWDDESEEETNLNVNSSLNSSLGSLNAKNQSNVDDDDKEFNEENSGAANNTEIIAETEKLLKETEELSSIHTMREPLDSLHASRNLRMNSFDRKSESEKDVKTGGGMSKETFNKPQKKDTLSSDNECKNVSEKDDKKSRLSCFDFDEDDSNEPSIPPVRKPPRVFGETSLKKEIIKEFEMSQALKNEIKKDVDKISVDQNIELKADEIIEIIQGSDHLQEEKKETKANKNVRDKTEIKRNEYKAEKITDSPELKDDKQKLDICCESDTKAEVLQVFEVVEEEGANDRTANMKNIRKKSSSIASNILVKTDGTSEKKNEIPSVDVAKINSKKSVQIEKTESTVAVGFNESATSVKEADDTLSERFTTETEDETVSESAETMPEQSENSDIDMLDRDQRVSVDRTELSGNLRETGQIIKRGRGRPRKNTKSSNAKDERSANKSPKVRVNRDSKKSRMSEKIEIERKTSDSDTDRSYSGRKRKPNKRYLESDIYVRDPEYKTLRTDESQSESDDKVAENITNKSRRGRRSRGTKRKSSEFVARINKQEIEVADQVSTAITENNIGVSSINITNETCESNVAKEAVFFKEHKRKPDERMEYDVFEESVKAAVAKVNVGAASGEKETLTKVTCKIRKIGLDSNKEAIENPSEARKKKDSIKLDNDVEEDVKDEIKSTVVQQAEDFLDKNETQRGISKMSVDILPPKKSQIKKFELSQIDVFDTDTQINKTAETAESEIKLRSASGIHIREEIDKKDELKIKVTDKITDGITKFLNIANEEEEEEEQHQQQQQQQISPKSCKVSELPDILERSPGEKERKTRSTDKISMQQMTDSTNKSELKSLEKSPSTFVESDNEGENINKKSTAKVITEERSTPKRSMQTRYKGKFIPETGAKGKKDKNLLAEEKPANTFQEAFLKTLHMDKKRITIEDTEMSSKWKKGKKFIKKKDEEICTANTAVATAQNTKVESSKEVSENIQIERKNLSDASVIDDITENVEVAAEEKVEVDLDLNVEDGVLKTGHLESSPDEFFAASKSSVFEYNAKIVSVSEKNSEEIAKTSTSVSSSSSFDSSVPVKKREMPRIIENVTLTEPVQILKTKLPDKLSQKGAAKHKLEANVVQKRDTKDNPKAKIMKIETLPSNSKMKASVKSSSMAVSSGPSPPSPPSSPRVSLTKKFQILKTEETDASFLQVQNEKQNVSTTQTLVTTEKYIQQDSQNLADIDLDINSMPFVLSDDVLTPESIEQMPVVISSIIPATGPITASSPVSATATLSLTPTTQTTQFKIANETAVVDTGSPSTKKKSGVPAILKTKKAKPTITSVKTLVPPFTGSVKSLKFQNAQTTGKTTPLLAQKSTTPGKYVVVQTAGGQQLRYSVQSKSAAGTQQKIAISPSKQTTAGNAQVVQQGGKVVILTSAQSCPTKMMPLNISKTLSGKVQRIVTSKGQVLCPINAQSGIIASKTIIAPKTDTAGTSTTSKLATGHKIINTQGIITSKAVLTPITGTIAKTALLGTLSPNILAKGIYTPISASSLSGKIIGSKTLVTKGATLLSSQNLGGTKTILTPVSQTIAGKTAILGTQAIVGRQGTVLTPITGQQVKAIAAKSPTKGAKVQYQQVAQKVQLQPIAQKSPKASMSPSTQPRTSAALKSSSAGTLVLQNPGIYNAPAAASAAAAAATATATAAAAAAQKGASHGKKIIKQTVMQPAITIQSIVPSTGGAKKTMATMPRVKSKGGKTAATVSGVQKVIIPRSNGRQTQQKIMVQKVQEPAVSTIHAKQTIVASSVNAPTVTKTVLQQSKQIASAFATSKLLTKSSHSSTDKMPQAQRNILNIAASSISTTATATNENLVTSLVPPPLEPISAEKRAKTDSQFVNLCQKEQGKADKSVFQAEKSSVTVTSEVTERTEEPKVAVAQPQIMALPTESSDGTQTYVLVTIDEQGQIQPLDNNALMSLEGTTQNPDGTRTLYIDPSSLGETGTLDNIVLQFDGGILPNIQTNVATEPTGQPIGSTESFPASEVIQTSNQDILAAALANTDFQQEINLPENQQTGSVMTSGLTQTSLINQTILQSTIIPPTEPISSPSVLETSLTLNQPIMTPLEVPSNLPIQSESTSTSSSSSVVSNIPSSLELPITITNPSISYISAGETQIQIPGNSMPDIGEIMENSGESGEIDRAEEVPANTRYLVIPNLDDNIAVTETQSVQSTTGIAVSPASYSVTVPNNVVLERSQVQTTPSMPIIDDTYTDNIPAQFATPIVAEPTFVDVSVSEMLVSKASASTENARSQNVSVTSEMILSSHQVSTSSRKPIVSSDAFKNLDEQEQRGRGDARAEEISYSSREACISSEELIVQQPLRKKTDDKKNDAATTDRLSMITNKTLSVTSESTNSGIEQVSFEVCSDSSESRSASSHSHEADAAGKLKQLKQSSEKCGDNNINLSTDRRQTVAMSSLLNEVETTLRVSDQTETPNPSASSDAVATKMDEKAIESGGLGIRDLHSSREESSKSCPVRKSTHLSFKEGTTDTDTEEAASQETPSQSQSQYEQYSATSAVSSDSADLPTQSAAKSFGGNLAKATQSSIAYDPAEAADEEEAVVTEPPTQSFEHSKINNEASQSYQVSMEASGANTPTQSFNEMMQSQEDGRPQNADDREAIDDQSFPTQSYEIDKGEIVCKNTETDVEISEEGNVPSQSNDIGADGIGTSSVSTNNSGLNEDETASSSYVPETPENQERDQEDQESAISTSSYEIPPCEELNIASSSVIPDTSVNVEHSSINDNGVPEIPTSSYNLNPDITSTHVDSGPTSSYEERAIIEQNVSTSYEVPISMPEIGVDKKTCSHENFAAESTDNRNEQPTSYYTHLQEVTESYYNRVDRDTAAAAAVAAAAVAAAATNSQLEGADPHEEVTPGYYEGNPQEVSQSYFAPAEETPSYTSHSISPSYYDPRPESEASQSYYSTDDLEKSEQSSSPNVEASQSFYRERSGELRLRQRGEATPTYPERYPANYELENLPIERHDLVESSVPATSRPTER